MIFLFILSVVNACDIEKFLSHQKQEVNRGHVWYYVKGCSSVPTKSYCIDCCEITRDTDSYLSEEDIPKNGYLLYSIKEEDKSLDKCLRSCRKVRD